MTADFLLDTHTLLWWWLDEAPLSIAARHAIASRAGTIFVSPVCAIEIAIKIRNGKLPEMEGPIGEFDDLVRRDGFDHLPITYDHARLAGLMAGRHRDPFDRLIAAQAVVERLTVISRDPAFAAFGCKVLW